MSYTVILTTCSPVENHGRAEKLRYRCNRLIEDGFDIIIVKSSITFNKKRINIAEGDIIYIGSGNTKYERKNEHEDTLENNKKSKIVKDHLVQFINYVSFIDTYMYSIPSTYFITKKIINSYSVDNLITQSYPFSNQIVGYYLTRSCERINWIMEYRDPWANNMKHFPDGLDPINSYYERECIRFCDSLIYYSNIQIPEGYLEEKYSEMEKKFFEIGNFGFNDDVIESQPPKEFDKFTMVYGGTIYENGAFTGFFEGLKEFTRKNNISPNDFQVIFIGDDISESEYKQYLQDDELSKYISSYQWKPYQELISYIKGADCALYVNRTLPKDELNVATKMYDYIGCQTPILCLSKKGWESWKLVDDHSVGVVADLSKKTKVKDSIEKMYNKNNLDFTEEVIENYSRNSQYREFKKLLVHPDES